MLSLWENVGLRVLSFYCFSHRLCFLPLRFCGRSPKEGNPPSLNWESLFPVLEPLPWWLNQKTGSTNWEKEQLDSWDCCLLSPYTNSSTSISSCSMRRVIKYRRVLGFLAHCENLLRGYNQCSPMPNEVCVRVWGEWESACIYILCWPIKHISSFCFVSHRGLCRGVNNYSKYVWGYTAWTLQSKDTTRWDVFLFYVASCCGSPFTLHVLCLWLGYSLCVYFFFNFYFKQQQKWVWRFSKVWICQSNKYIAGQNITIIPLYMHGTLHYCLK